MNYKTICDTIIEDIQKQTEKFNGVVIGISGGIDSAVVAALSVLALSPEKVYGLTIPYHDQSTKDADELASALGISYDNVNIGPRVDDLVKTLSLLFKIKTSMPKSNIQARERMVILYGAANSLDKLVIGTTNKSEYLLGYFTKYGDGAVDFEPIGDLYKTEVLELARYLKQNHFPNFPQQIIDKKPSADLEHGMTDEEELGFSYEEFDKVIKEGEEWADVDPKKIDKMNKWHRQTKHKRELPQVTKVDKK